MPINRIKSNTLRDNHNLIKIIMNKIPCYNEEDSNEHNSHVTIQITHYEQKNELIAVIQFGQCLSGCIWFGYGKHYICIYIYGVTCCAASFIHT